MVPSRVRMIARLAIYFSRYGSGGRTAAHRRRMPLWSRQQPSNGGAPAKGIAFEISITR